MKEMIIKKDALMNLLTGRADDCQVFAPVEVEGSLVIKEIQPGDEITTSSMNTKASIKETFFPQRERLFSYDLSKPGEMKEPPFSDRKRIVFGIRPCDAKSLTVFDCVFKGKDYPDPYYIDKRDNTIVIAVGCNEPSTTCFCSDTGAGPFSTDGADLLLVDLDGSYLVRVVTEKGESFVNENTAFAEAVQQQAETRDAIVDKATKAVHAQVNPDKVKKKLDDGFDSNVWDIIHEKCIGCGTCTYLCPTCHCFDIVDETTGTTGERLRIWDSCMYPFFTLHASGGNPRKTGKERMRQRVMHKFKYFVDNNEMVACTGCGRCVKYCPVNLDIREILKQIEVS